MTGPAATAAADPVDPRATPRLAALRDVLRAEYGFFKGVVERNARAFGPDWALAFEDTIARVFPTADALALAARGYALFALDLMRRQRRFERERAYPAKTYAEAAREVYHDDAYMTSQYLPGLLLSHFLWPHHWWHGRFFESAFVAPMRRCERPAFAEVGIGTGLYSRRILEEVPGATGAGFDISAASAAFAERHVAAFGASDRYAVALRDVAQDPPDAVDWLVCVEVLEHLEDPVEFLRHLRRMLRPGGRAFVTAALNAAHVDHIHLYEGVDDVAAHLLAAGFALEQGFSGHAYAPPRPGVPVPAVAAFVVS